MYENKTPKKKYQYKESALQRDCTYALGLKYPKPKYSYVWFKIKNEGKTNAIKGRIDNLEGRKAGMPDCGLIVNGITYYFEFKSQDGRLSPAQKKTHQEILDSGGSVWVVDNLDYFLQVVSQLIARV